MSGCANGGFGNGGFALGAPVERLDYIPRVEMPTTGRVGLAAPVTLIGASFQADRNVVFNRLCFHVTAFAAPASGVMLIYQGANGNALDSLPLIATASFTPVGVATLQVALDEGIISLSAGYFYALWGKASGAGSFSVLDYVTATIIPFENPGITGTHPTIASSALLASAPPITIDPRVGGDLVGGAGADNAPIIRFRSV